MAGLWGPSLGSWAWMITSQFTTRHPALADPGDHLGQQPRAVEPLPTGIRVRIMLADVAQAGRSQEGVGHRVTDDVGIGMAHQSPRMVDPLAAQDQGPPLVQPVGVMADSDSQALSSSQGSPSGFVRRTVSVVIKFRPRPHPEGFPPPVDGSLIG